MITRKERNKRSMRNGLKRRNRQVKPDDFVTPLTHG